jgi:hypothetical protein
VNRLSGYLANLPRLLLYAGLVLVVAGAVLIAIAWGKTAGQTAVALQVPYLLSAGFPGLGLVVVGMISVHIGIRTTEARERSRQNAELLALLATLREAREADPLPQQPTPRKSVPRKSGARKSGARKSATKAVSS